MTPQEFIAVLAPLAMASAQATGIPAGFVLAEAALESGWGKSELTTLARNLFGVKASAGWHGDTLTMDTEEVLGGKKVVISASWRKYVTWDDCVNDHAQFFLQNPRYAEALKVRDNSEDFARAIAAAGYATDPDYAARLIAVMHSHNLAQYDAQSAAA